MNQPAQHGELPLHLAAGSGSMDTVRTLLMRRSLINSRCLDGWTPLHWATRYQHLEIVKVSNPNIFGYIKNIFVSKEETYHCF